MESTFTYNLGYQPRGNPGNSVDLLQYLGTVAHKYQSLWALVVAQLVGWSLLTPNVRNSNPVIGNIYIECLLSTVYCFEKQKMEKEAGNCQFFSLHSATVW